MPHVDRRYRTGIEVLRDVLTAVRQEPKKTRIIAVANLNPVTFVRYQAYCDTLGLIQRNGDGYHLTPRGAAAIDGIDRLLAQAAEIERRLAELQRVFGAGGNGSRPNGDVARLASHLVLSDAGRQEGPSNGHRERDRIPLETRLDPPAPLPERPPRKKGRDRGPRFSPRVPAASNPWPPDPTLVVLEPPDPPRPHRRAP